MRNSSWALKGTLVLGTILVVGQLTKGQSDRAGGLEFLNPAGLSSPTGYTHIVVAQPGKIIYVSGQVALNAAGEVVGKGDLRAQTTQAMENIKTALAAAGARTWDVIKLNYYVVGLKPNQVPIIREVRSKYFSVEHPPASTLIGVTSLAREEFMIEIEVVARAK